MSDPRKTVRDAAVTPAANVTIPMPSDQLGIPPGAADPVSTGAYRIVRKLGEGGMGAVYLAEQRSPQRFVALKVIRPDRVSPRVLLRFRLESQILAWLRHPAVAQVYESGEVDGPHGPQPYYAMEFVEGDQLDRYATAQNLDDRGRLELLAAVCDGVEAAHRRGITHRDLKPANVVVADGQPKILDFGIARVSDPEAAPDADRTAEGQVVGTLNYMSPEQAAGDQSAIDTRTDVYSLGVILYELLSGRLPLDLSGKSLQAAAREIITAELPSLSALDRRFRGDVSAIAAKALAKDPRERYQSAADLATDIRRYLADLPIQARPPGALAAFRKFARRNKAVVASVAVAVTALVTGIGFATYGMLEAKAETKRANGEAENARQAEGRERGAKEEETKAKTRAEAELASRTFAVGRYEQRQGKYREALASLRKARELGYPDEVEYLLATLDSQIGLAQVKEARETAIALGARKDWGRHKAEVLLVLGDAGFTFGLKFGAEPEDLVMQALLVGLPPAKASYARAITSTTLADMERHLADSISLDPANPDAAPMLAFCQIILGKFGDARMTLGRLDAMSPGTLGVRVLEVALALFERDAAGVDRAVKRVAEISPPQAEALAEIAKLVLPLLTDDLFWQFSAPLASVKVAGQFLALVPKLTAAIGQPGSDLGALDRVVNYPILRGMKGVNLVKALTNPTAVPDVLDFEQLPEKAPISLFYAMRGRLRAARGDFARGLADCEQALELPSSLPMRKPVLAHYATMLFWVHRRPNSMILEGPPRERLKWALRELAKMGPVPDDAETENLVLIACFNDELVAATVLASEMVNRKSDDARVLSMRALMANAHHAHLDAFLAAQAALKKDPNDIVAQRVYKESGRQLKEWATGQFGPPKDAVIPPAQP